MTRRIKNATAVSGQSYDETLRRLDRLERGLGEVNHNLSVSNDETSNMRRAMDRLLEVADRRFKATLKNGSSSE